METIILENLSQFWGYKVEKDFFKDFYKFKIYVGSLARSGSTYLKYSIENQYTPQVSIDKSHNPVIHQNRADGIFNCDEFVFAARPPRETLKSQLIWRLSDQRLTPPVVKSLFDEATDLWEIVLTSPEEFFIVDFGSITSKESEIISALETKNPSLKSLRSETPLTVEKVKLELEKSSKDGMGINQYIERGHLPREISKHDEIAESVLESKSYTRRLGYLESLYQDLISYKKV